MQYHTAKACFLFWFTWITSYRFPKILWVKRHTFLKMLNAVCDAPKGAKNEDVEFNLIAVLKNHCCCVLELGRRYFLAEKSRCWPHFLLKRAAFGCIFCWKEPLLAAFFAEKSRFWLRFLYDVVRSLAAFFCWKEPLLAAFFAEKSRFCWMLSVMPQGAKNEDS